jgi:hypothetical protein
MPINSTLQYYKQLLDELPMPGGAPPLRVFITPPPVDDNPMAEPHGFIWFTDGEENRAPDRGGTVPRALTKPMWLNGAAVGTPNCGTKAIDHAIHMYIIWDQANDDEQADSWFPGMLDAIAWQLRVSQDPATIIDSYDGTLSTLIDVGETISYQSTVRFLADQRMLRYNALFMLPTLELIQS